MENRRISERHQIKIEPGEMFSGGCRFYARLGLRHCILWGYADAWITVKTIIYTNITNIINVVCNLHCSATARYLWVLLVYEFSSISSTSTQITLQVEITARSKDRKIEEKDWWPTYHLTIAIQILRLTHKSCYINI